METELNPGDRVHWIGRPGTFVVEPLAQHRVQIRSEQEGTIFTPLASELTRISPDVPLFRVGQTVRRISLPNRVGTVVQLEARVNWADAIYENVSFGVLEAVPEVCQTCGGKVADG